MKRIYYLTAVVLALFSFSLKAQSSNFSSIINSWADYAGFEVYALNDETGSAVFKKSTLETENYLGLRIYDGFVELRVFFYSVSDLSEALGNKAMAEFLLGTLYENSEYPFGAWGIASTDDGDSFGMFYGIPTRLLDKESFSVISNTMIDYADKLDGVISKYTQRGFGMASKSNVDKMLDDIKEISKKYKQKAEKQLGEE